ncbi:hypothetical protein DPMN_070478 [Dreissena polymorpha]|uniref:Uncharacterized protein n=1 Tax=Dreissena polymorpha TaxID=45954 RepID=A0A9D3Z5H8_DREPO|nr:hypothetical protein DPMN_070478 [Dreissena polymorpha]
MAFSVVVALVAPVAIVVITAVKYAKTVDETVNTKCVLHMDRHAYFVNFQSSFFLNEFD